MKENEQRLTERIEAADAAFETQARDRYYGEEHLDQENAVEEPLEENPESESRRVSAALEAQPDGTKGQHIH